MQRLSTYLEEPFALEYQPAISPAWSAWSMVDFTLEGHRLSLGLSCLMCERQQSFTMSFQDESIKSQKSFNLICRSVDVVRIIEEYPNAKRRQR